MARNKEGRPVWFKMFLHQRALIDAVPDDIAGKALKAVFHYFDTGECAELDTLSSVVFAAIKPNIDDSFRDFQRSSESGKAGNKKRWCKDVSGGDTPQSPPVAPYPEEDKEDRSKKKEDRGKKIESKADKPLTRSRFSAPSVEEVKAYCAEKGYTNVDPERFVDYYMSVGWKVGKNPMKDWEATVRNWEKREQKKGTANNETSGIQYSSIGPIGEILM